MKTKLNQNTNIIKIVALITMFIDHVGLILLDNNIFLRCIGRISFPLFFYSIFVGYFKTKDLKKYIIRLFILFLISEPIYILAFNRYDFNICFSFIIELLFLYFIDHKHYLLYIITFTISLFYIPISSYMIFIIFLTPIFYYTKNTKFLFSISYILFYLVFIYFGIPYIYIYSLFALPLILFNIKTKVKINKYFFYAFYPAHLLLLYITKLLFN